MKKFLSKIAYSLLPLLICAGLMYLTFYGNQAITDNAEPESWHYGTTWPYTPFDDKIPLVPWFIYIYHLAFLFVIIFYLLAAAKNKKLVYDVALTISIAFLLSGIIYFFFQSRLIKPDFTPVTFTDKFLFWTWNATNPTNNFPSQHCYIAIAQFLCCFDCKQMNGWLRFVGCGSAIMVVLSTVLTKQHYWLDFVGALAIMLPIYLIIKHSGFGTKTAQKFDSFYAKFKRKSREESTK